jgi:hypothetical protein
LSIRTLLRAPAAIAGGSAVVKMNPSPKERTKSISAVDLGDIDEFAKRRDIPIHRVNGFENDQLRPLRIVGAEQPLKVGRVIMTEYPFFHAAVTHPLDHRIVVEGIRIEYATRDLRCQRRQSRHVGDIAGRKQQRGFLAMQVRQFALQQYVVMVGAGNVARAAGAGAAALEPLLHRGDRVGILAHPEIIVGAPDRDVVNDVAVMTIGPGIITRLPLKIGKDTVISLPFQLVNTVREITFVIHRRH